ncbi:MAG: MBL fold metallo-hydrolase [Fusicatenibacter sp.]|nr:MBL fold metallo-hydrolase [Fusicatenibacter sp.]
MKLCSIASGSSGNCIFAGSETTSLLVDAGISGKRTEAGLNSLNRTVKELDGILITHEHIDHIQGLGVLARRYQTPIYATGGTIEALKRCTGLGKFPDGIFHKIYADEPFEIGDIRIQPFAISHDAAEPVGYRMESCGKAMAIATDLGIYNDYIIRHLKGLNAVLLEANHDENMLAVGPYPYPLKQRIAGAKGHLSNTMAGHLLCEILHDDLKDVLLGHLSKENNYEALAFETVACEVTTGDNPYRSSDFHIAVAKRSEVSPLIEV